METIILVNTFMIEWNAQEFPTRATKTELTDYMV